MTRTAADHAAPSGTTTEQTTLLRVDAVSKAFGPTQAVADASLELHGGEVLAIAGENGSGKSTLVKILSGVHAPDSGWIELAGAGRIAPRNPRAAQELGIATVFQEVLVAEARSVLDNVWLGIDGALRSRVPRAEKRERANELFEELLGRRVSLDRPAEELSLSDRQACCIVRALVRNPRILILDEATSALDIATRDRLFTMVGRLGKDGVGVVVITHRMDELSEIGDRITVMRSGRTVSTLERGAWSRPQLVRLMTGSEQPIQVAEPDAAGHAERIGATVLSATGLQLQAGRRVFDTVIRAGERVGVAGLEGHGQVEFLDALRGAGVFAGEVVSHRGGTAVAIRSVAKAARAGIAYVPRERRQASFAWMSIRENFGMPTLGRDRRLGLLNHAATGERFADFVQRLGIVLGSPDDAITTLSGGNQQKVVIARWLAAAPAVLVLNDPTRGIDIGAKRDLYGLLTELSNEGVAVVMLSSELDELVELMDRVIVFREHEPFGEIPRARLTRQALVSAFFGEGEATGDEQ